MKKGFHTDAMVERWNGYSLFEQLGNIGSEVGRALKWREALDEAKATNAAYRALELFDLTLEDRKHYAVSGRLREIARSREAFADFFFW